MSAVAGTTSRATVAVVLAAGGSRRFGGTKQLAELGGRTLVAHVVAAAYAGGVHEVVVVVGHDATSVAQAARVEHDVRVVHTPDVAAGQSASLLAGITAALDLDAEVVVVLLADQPEVAPGAVRAAVASVRGGASAARIRYDDGPGHPVAFARRALARLATLHGDRGARGLLDELGVVEVTWGGPAPVDLDTRAAWQAALRRWETKRPPPTQRNPSWREHEGQARHP